MFKLLLTTLSILSLSASVASAYPYRSFIHPNHGDRFYPLGWRWRTYIIQTEVNYITPPVREVQIDSTQWYDFATPLWDKEQHNDDDMVLFNSLQEYCDSTKNLSEDLFQSVFTCL